MKILLMCVALLYSSFSLASQTASFFSKVKNYGGYDIQKLEFILRYDSHSGGDGTCSACIHREFNFKIEKDGGIHFPSIPLDSKSTRHSFSLKVVNSYDHFDKQWIYSCDVLNDKFENCEDVLADELKVLSAYSFDTAPLEISLTSGMPIKEWIEKISNMTLQVHVSANKPKYGDHLGWNTQIFGNCDADKCFIREGAILFVGDLGFAPELFYQITAAEFPKTYSPIPGINGLEFSSSWSGSIPKSLLNFQVDDK